jgi:hypothetical protein
VNVAVTFVFCKRQYVLLLATIGFSKSILLRRVRQLLLTEINLDWRFNIVLVAAAATTTTTTTTTTVTKYSYIAAVKR